MLQTRRTRWAYRSLLDELVLTYWEDVRLFDIDFGAIQTWVSSLSEVVVTLRGQLMAVIDLETDGHIVRAIRAIGNPQKLAHLNH